ALARRNAASVRFRHAPIEIREGDAALADYSLGTVFFLFNPFGMQTTEAVLDKIHKSVMQHPRRVRLIYIHPYAAYPQAFAAAQWLRLVEERPFISIPDHLIMLH